MPVLFTADNKRTDPHPPHPNGGMSVRKFVGPPTDLSSVDNLRGSRPSEGQRSRPFKATQAVQSEGKDTAETLNPKHSEGVLHNSEVVCTCVRARA